MSNPELAAARRAVPEIEAADNRLDAAKELLAEAPHAESPDAAREAVITKAAEDFLSGVAWPKDIGKRAAKAYDDADAVLVDRQARQIAVRRAEFAVYDAVDRHTEDALTYLGTRLEALLSDARSAFGIVGDVSTAEAAIEAGADVVAAWSRLRTLVDDVSNLRAAQWALLRGPQVPGTPAHGGDWRGREWLRAGFGHVRTLSPDEAPEGVRRVLRDVSKRVTQEYLRWLASRDDAYVPGSEDELAGDVAVLTTPISLNDSGQPADYYEPRVRPERPGRPAEIYPHSQTPQLDYAGPTPAAPKPNATVADEAPARSYF
ncbi:hypothetical protein AB0F77_40385 [Streptomyces sp. NPDC026672]|uniref:hypothetical protein n=1 Tax=Actinomycetes TaxID=1760 RepID=UPI0033F6BD69